MEKLQAYKLDKAFTDGVVIRLDSAPDVEFLVRLPSQYNRGYTQAVYGDAGFTLGENGQVEVKGGGVVEIKWRQEDAFADHCLVSIDGDPVPADFREQYPAAISELFMKANQLAQEVDGRVGEAAKKSLASLTGSRSGEDAKISTQSLSGAAS